MHARQSEKPKLVHRFQKESKNKQYLKHATEQLRIIESAIQTHFVVYTFLKHIKLSSILHGENRNNLSLLNYIEVVQ